jgi:hypothetical protein
MSGFFAACGLVISFWVSRMSRFKGTRCAERFVLAC